MKQIFIILTILLGITHTAAASDYRYISAAELKGLLEASKPVLLVDIQEPQDFATHHIKGSMETNGYPVKTDQDRAKLQNALQQSLTEKYESIVVVCPRGKGGAKRTYDFLAENGTPDSKLYILTDGMAKWPYQEWVAKK